MIAVARRAAVGAAFALALGAACSGPDHAKRTQQSAALSEGVVAAVDGDPIALSEVERLAHRGALTPSAALARLEAEALLAAEAARRGYGDAPEVSAVAAQALVQLLLERDVEREKPSPSELDEALAQRGERIHTPELRAATHVLAVLPKQPTPEQESAARAFVDDAARKLREASDPLATITSFRQASPERQRVGVEIKVEELPPFPREGAVVREFGEAMFALAKPGAVGGPVRTQFGWHVLVLREILPEKHVPEAEVRAELEAELTLQKRQKRVEVLLRTLSSRTRVTYGNDVKNVLAQLEF